MKLLGRKVVVSKLDPVPEGMRFGPDVVVLNDREIAVIRSGAGAVFTAELQTARDSYDKERLRRILEEAGC